MTVVDRAETMIEKVAKVLAGAHWGKLEYRDQYMLLSRAAIKEMLQPTSAMISAATDQLVEFDHHGNTIDLSTETAKDVWRVMAETAGSSDSDAVDPSIADTDKHQNEFWPGFTVTCTCGSTNVHLDNSLGFSPESGGWGSVDFKCQECGASTEIVSS